jgi:hypothetical protein
MFFLNGGCTVAELVHRTICEGAIVGKRLIVNARCKDALAHILCVVLNSHKRVLMDHIYVARLLALIVLSDAFLKLLSKDCLECRIELGWLVLDAF